MPATACAPSRRRRRATVPATLSFAWRSAALALCAIASGAGPVRAQETAPRCASEEFRQFDFWLGEWEVTDPDGNPVGRSRIERTLGGCVIQEHWDAGQVRGTSLNIYDAPSGVWRQSWVDNRGVLLRIEGGLDGDAMRMRGERLGGDGKTRVLRITWTPLDDGVRQVQEVSEDGGTRWNVAFDGRYRPSSGG